MHDFDTTTEDRHVKRDSKRNGSKSKTHTLVRRQARQAKVRAFGAGF